MNFKYQRAFGARAVLTSKTPRKQLMRLVVEAETSGQALMRILNLIELHAARPLTISASFGDTCLRLAIDLDPLPAGKASAMLAKIETLVEVEKARLTRRRGNPVLMLKQLSRPAHALVGAS